MFQFMTDEEFRREWKKISNKQKKFCLRYIENGFDQMAAAVDAGYQGCYLKSPTYRIMRRLSPIIDYLVAKNNIIQSIVKPGWVLDQYMKLYESTTSEITKQNILKELSKILQMQTEAAKVEVTNNIPQIPVTINFGDEDEE